jgi:predicted transcriptional regulator
LTEQIPLDWNAKAHARRRDPETSQQAARSMEGAAQAICAKLLAAIRAQGPSTQHELAAAVGLDGYRVGKRLSDLRNAQLIEPKGEETRPGPSNRAQTVWQLKI